MVYGMQHMAEELFAVTELLGSCSFIGNLILLFPSMRNWEMCSSGALDSAVNLCALNWGMAETWGCADVFPAVPGRKESRGGCRSTFWGLSEWGGNWVLRNTFMLWRGLWKLLQEGKKCVFVWSDFGHFIVSLWMESAVSEERAVLIYF